MHLSSRYMVYELQAMSLEDVLTRPQLHPLPRRQMQDIAAQLISGLSCAWQVSRVLRLLTPDVRSVTFDWCRAYRHQARQHSSEVWQ